MPNTWAIAGVDLLVEPAGRRRRDGLERALREAIQAGRLHPGTRLPSSRALAADLGLARNTVASAYGQLVAEGWLEARQGSGTRVADRVAPPSLAERPAIATPSAVRYDLRPGRPDLSAFPRTAWLAAARRALARAPHDALGYGDPRGRPELRAALAAYLGRVRGVRADPERIVVCSGFVQGLALLAAVLAARGATLLAAEAYGLDQHRATVAAHGLGILPLPVDEHGAVLSSAGAASAVLLTPAHQFPLGVPLAPHRRREAVGWATATGGLVIEDDYDGEFRYDRQAVGAMQALAPDHVVYGGTASKSLAPGLRLAWLVLPPHLVEEVVEAKRRADTQGSVVEQLTLAELITSGVYDRHVRRARLAYQRRRTHLLDRLSRSAPLARVPGAAAGLHALVELPPGLGEEEAIADGAGRGLALDGLDSFALAGGNRPPALVVGYATPPEHAFSGAVARLCTVLDRAG